MFQIQIDNFRIETSRLLMIPFKNNYNYDCFSWLLDKDVMDTTFGGADNIETIELRIKRYIQHQKSYGVSKWLVLMKNEMLPIGDAGLYRFDQNTIRYDLGFRIMKNFWGIGLGSEIVDGWIKYARFYNYKALYAFTNFNNPRSEGLLKKFKFKFELETTLYGKPVKKFILDLS